MKYCKEKITELLNDDTGFLELEDKTAKQWHDMCSYFLSKIKNHETELKHTVRLWAARKTDFNTNKTMYRKIWICENCNKVFLKCKYDPELLKIKEFYQMCFDGKLIKLAEQEYKEQIKKITK